MAEFEGQQSIEIKTPKRILHFSDGTLEEFDEDETEEINTLRIEQIDEVYKKCENDITNFIINFI